MQPAGSSRSDSGLMPDRARWDRRDLDDSGRTAAPDVGGAGPAGPAASWIARPRPRPRDATQRLTNGSQTFTHGVVAPTAFAVCAVPSLRARAAEGDPPPVETAVTIIAGIVFNLNAYDADGILCSICAFTSLSV